MTCGDIIPHLLIIIVTVYNQFNHVVFNVFDLKLFVSQIK